MNFIKIENCRLNKNDSADSNENGDDMPIEIRHLEDSEDMLYIPPLFSSLIGETTLTRQETLDSSVLMIVTCSGHGEQLSKSKSLNDITALVPLAGQRKMRTQGRCNTCDDPTVTPGRQTSKAETDLVSEASGSGWLTGAFFERPHLGSLSSLSSAKSAVRSVAV